MKITVYADVLFAVNFIINIILISITAMIGHQRSGGLRRAAAAAAGAVYAVFMFMPKFEFAGEMLCKFILSLIITAIAFAGKSIKVYLKCLCLFYLVSLVCGGCALALIYYSGSSSGAGPVTVSNGIIYFDTSLMSIIVCSAASYAIIRISFGIYKRYTHRSYHRIVLCKNGKAVTLNVLLDTGNMLRDPISGNPVIVVDKSALKGIIPKGLNTADIENASAYINDIRLIPFKSLGTENGLMMGFKPDKIFADAAINENITIAISNQSLCTNGEYNALAGPESFIDKE